MDASLGPVIVREAPEISSLTTPSLPVGALGPTSVIVLPRARARRGKGKLFLGGVLALSALGVVGYLMLWPDAPAQEKAQAALLHHPPAMKAGAPAPAPDVPVASAPTSPEEGKEPETSVAPAPPEAETLTTTGEVRLVRLEILTSPDGALVELDGEPLGETPLIRKIPYGEEKALLRITKEGLAPLEISFTPNALYRNTFTLKPEGKAKKAASRAKSRRGRRGRRGR